MSPEGRVSETHDEIELRLAVGDPVALQAALRHAGARLLGQGRVETASFDFPDRSLRAARQTLRLRRDWSGVTLTAKLRRSDTAEEDATGIKRREEINLPLGAGSAAAARRLLLGIGLEETLRYEKERVSFALGDARIDVDVLADGGACYVEIEADPTTIEAVRATLGLADAPVELRSYFEIVRLAREQGPGVRG
jgi:adenylate cyclase class IV